MPARVPEQELDIVVKFGAGLHTRAGEESVDEAECTDGQNFKLDYENNEFRRREPFDHVGTVPNGQPIYGFAQLKKSDGTKSTLIQAGTKVYEWDGTMNGFTDTGVTVSSNARLRGHPIAHKWPLSTEVVIITDLGFTEPVKKWDGTTLSDITFSGVSGDFIAKYCFVSNERAFFGYVSSNSTDTPHLLVGSMLSDYTTLSVSSRPSSGATAADPFYLTTLDLKPINGLVEAFGKIAISSKDGNIFVLNGQDKTDFAVSELHPQSGANGEEAMVFVGDDIWYGRRGRIESLAATDAYGDVEPYDPSVAIQDSIAGKAGWVSAYNSQLQRVYFMHDDMEELWVYYKPLRGTNKSPWIKYTTTHDSNFTWTAQMMMFAPTSADDSEYLYFGDSSGNIYQLEGTGSSGDAGTDTIVADRTSKLFSMPLDAEMFQVEGWIKYHKLEDATVNIYLLHAGQQVFDAPISVNIAAPTGADYFGGDVYFGGDFFFGIPKQNRVVREIFAAPSGSNEVQVKVEVDSNAEFRINEIGLRFNASS